MAQKIGVVLFLLIGVSWATKDLSNILSKLSKGGNGDKPVVLVLDNKVQDSDEVESPYDLLSKLAHIQIHRPDPPIPQNRQPKFRQNRHSPHSINEYKHRNNELFRHKHRTQDDRNEKFDRQNSNSRYEPRKRNQKMKKYKYKYITDFDLSEEKRVNQHRHPKNRYQDEYRDDDDYQDDNRGVYSKNRYEKNRYRGSNRDERNQKHKLKNRNRYSHRHEDHHKSDRRPKYHTHQQERDDSEYEDDRQRYDRYESVKSPIVKSLLRISDDLNCGAQTECKDECDTKFVNDKKKDDKCQNKCEQKFECDEKKDDDDNQCEDKNECEATMEDCEEGDGHVSTRGVLFEEEKTKCKRCKK